MSTPILSYIKGNSFLHELSGTTKLICFLSYSIATMVTYDTRILFFMFLFGIFLFKLSKLKYSQISFVLYFILFFLLINNIAIFLFSPLEGTEIYGTKHNLFHIGWHYDVTLEQLFYQLNITLKYFAVIPVGLLFILTTNPSEFASSMNRIGVSYKIAYSISIALRYIPDVQRDFQEISFAQQARGIDLSRNEKLFKRLKNASAILLPLILSSLDRIDTISSAMELRGFGTREKRTWYNERPLKKNDIIAIIVILILVLLSILSIRINGGRFYNPF